MKLLKNCCSIFLVIALLLCQITSVSAATGEFSDVPATSSFSDAIYTLSDFGIILGDAGASTFRPEANISREEFSVIMTRVLGLGGVTVSITEYPFTDVTPSTCADWSINATKIAFDLGIINGYSEGVFGPKDPVTYEQAVKMIVCALGYKQMAENAGGWPLGYITVAKDKGILKKADAQQEEPASRQIIAQLIFNSLDVDMMETLTSASGTTYRVAEGVNFLNSKLKITKAKGIVTGTSSSSLKADSSNLKDTEVEIDFDKKYSIGETPAKSLFGKSVTYYYKTNNDESTLLSVRENKDNDEYVINSDCIKSINSGEIQYYTDADDKSDYETLSVATISYAVFNGVYFGPISAAITPDEGKVTFIDSDGNGSIDLAIVESTSAFVVSAVDASSHKLYNKLNQSDTLVLDTDSKDIITITKNGTKMNFSDIKKNDVLLVKASKNTSGKKNIDVKIISNIVNGNIDSMTSDMTSISVATKEYKLSDKLIAYLNANSSEKPSMGDKVTLYIDDNNVCVYLSATTVTSSVYGYIVSAGVASRDECAQIKLITTASKSVTLDTADKVKINGTSYDYDEVPGILATTNSLTNKDSGVENNTYAQLIEYTTNSSGLINSITTMTQSGDRTKELILSAPYTAETYALASKTFGTKTTLSTSTKVLYVPTDRSLTEDYSFKTYSSLKNNTRYSYEAYDSTETGVPAVIVVYNYNILAAEKPMVIIDGITSAYENEQSLLKLTCYYNGVSKVYYSEDQNVLDGFQKGDVITLTLNSKDYISAVTEVFSVNNIPAENTTGTNGSSPECDVRYYTSGSYAPNLNAEHLTLYGTVNGRDDTRMTISLFDVDADENLNAEDTYPISFTSATKVYILDNSDGVSNANKLTEGTVDSIAGYASAKAGASKVFTSCANGITKFIIVIK